MVVVVQVVLMHELVGDWPMLPVIAGKGLKLVTVVLVQMVM